MGAYLGVQQGSMFPPQFVHLHYKPENPTGDVVKVTDLTPFLLHLTQMEPREGSDTSRLRSLLPHVSLSILFPYRDVRSP